MTATKVYMIPIPIADGMLDTLSPQVKDATSIIKHYFAENVRTARRALKAINPVLIIEELQFSEIDKNTGIDIALLKQWIKQGVNIGVLSESGCPGIADPGADIVSVAQENNLEVIPLTGPNSLILALMASGLNGQKFCFNGYLPIKEPARSQKIKSLEANSAKELQTELFIETPYRNNALLDELLKNCKGHTRLCIAQNITAPDAFIKTKTIDQWKKNKPELAKAPAVFLLLSN